jgi:type I restriction enzyme, S subunit
VTATPPPATGGWANTRLDRVASVTARIGWKALTADEYVPEGFVFLATPNIKSDQIDFENVNFITEFRYEESPELKLQVGDVLLVKDGNTLGITNVIRDLPRPATVNGSIAVIRSQTMVPAFLRYVLASDFMQGRIAAYRAGMGVPHLFQADIKKFPLPQPPLVQQQAIADYLDAETARIDALIFRYHELVDRLMDQRAAITVAGVSGESLAGPCRATSLSWLTEVPAHWADVRLTVLARLGSGHTPSREHPEWWIDCTIPWITTGEVWQIRDDRIEYLIDTREMISQIGLANSSAELHPAGTVVLSRTASAGFSAIMATDMATSQDYVTWTCGPRLRPRFLLLCLRAMRQDLLGRLAMGSTHQTIYVPDIQSIRIPLPPLEEQDQMVEWVWQRLHRIDAAVDGINRQIDLLAERRQALITNAVTGQLEIRGVAA